MLNTSLAFGFCIGKRAGRSGTQVSTFRRGVGSGQYPPGRRSMWISRRLDDFQDYYENRHVPLCEKYLSGVTRYLRRFLAPHTNPETGTNDELAFDVITELWFEDEPIFRGTVQYLTTSILPEEVVSDEKQLFDRSKTRMATVMECESDSTR